MKAVREISLQESNYTTLRSIHSEDNHKDCLVTNVEGLGMHVFLEARLCLPLVLKSFWSFTVNINLKELAAIVLLE